MKAKLRRYYTPEEVSSHSTPLDCWVSFLGGVYNITRIIKEDHGMLSAPLLSAAGKDISHWFDADSGDLRYYVDPGTNILTPYCPQGRFVHVPPMAPSSSWDTSLATPWWKDKLYRVGNLSTCVRPVRIKNMLTQQEAVLEVPREETIGEIRDRYLDLNAHASSYTFKALRKQADGELEFEPLELHRTLVECGLEDEREAYEEHSLSASFYVPVLHVYWNDDLTEA